MIYKKVSIHYKFSGVNPRYPDKKEVLRVLKDTYFFLFIPVYSTEHFLDCCGIIPN